MRNSKRGRRVCREELIVGELGHSLRAFGNRMLSKLTSKNKTSRGLDLASRDGLLLVVACNPPSLAGDALKDVVNKRVHDGHRPLAHTHLWVDLLEDLVDVGVVGLVGFCSALETRGRDLHRSSNGGLDGEHVFLKERVSGGLFDSFKVQKLQKT